MQKNRGFLLSNSFYLEVMYEGGYFRALGTIWENHEFLLFLVLLLPPDSYRNTKTNSIASVSTQRTIPCTFWSSRVRWFFKKWAKKAVFLWNFVSHSCHNMYNRGYRNEDSIISFSWWFFLNLAYPGSMPLKLKVNHQSISCSNSWHTFDGQGLSFFLNFLTFQLPIFLFWILPLEKLA